MQNLEETVLEIQQQISEFRKDYLSNEHSVRVQLIDPILTALGWKTANPKIVKHNFSLEDGKIPDYTLLKNSKNILIVEAKNLSIILTDKKVIIQLSQYCYNQGVSFGILTNGGCWLLFSTFQKNPLERIVWQVDIEKENIKEVVRKLSSFAYDNIDRLDEILQKSKMLEDGWSGLVNSTNDIISIIAQKLNERIKILHPRTSIESDELYSFTKGKILEQFEEFKIDNDDIHNDTGTPYEANKETAFSEVEDAVFKREKKSEREKIAVTFQDGTKLYDKTVAVVFTDVIRKVGIERIKDLNIQISRVPLISEAKFTDRKYQQRQLGKYWIMTNVQTKQKYRLLLKINNALSLGLKIEKFIPE